MDEKDIFNTPQEEAEHLAGELGEIKNVLRELLRKVARIETRAERAFPSAFRKTGYNLQKSHKVSSTGPPTMSADEVMRVFEEVIALAKAGNTDQARRRLEAMNPPDLNLLRTELGASLGKKKPSKSTILEAVLGRVKESVLLSYHANRGELTDRVAEDITPFEKTEKSSSG
jgi:hypothetical protein